MYCLFVGGYMFLPGTERANSLVSLLKNNSVAQPEVSAYSRFWILNGITILLYDDQVNVSISSLMHLQLPLTLFFC